MGGSAESGGNAQLLSLISQYGGGGGGGYDQPEFDVGAWKKQIANSLTSGGMNPGTPPRQKGGSAVSPFYAFDMLLSRGGRGGGGGGPGGGIVGSKPNKPYAPPQPVGIDWQFPQYTQTWAFTPPKPTPYLNPPPFNPNTYMKGKNKK